MTTYIYAVCDDTHNQIKTVSATSLNNAQEKIIEKCRDYLEIDEEYDTWMEFIRDMENYNLYITPNIKVLEELQ